MTGADGVGPADDAERATPAGDVAAAAFGAAYRYFYADRLADGRSMADVGRISQYADLANGDRILDLGCGHGRIANRLAQHGVDVVGLDISGPFLVEAAANAEGSARPARYVRGDLRALPFATSFDVVVCWYTTFGYFDDAGDRSVLDGALRVLRPGGLFVFDVNLLDDERPQFVQAAVVERGEDLMVEQFRHDKGTLVVTRTVVWDGEVDRARYAIRLYRPEEIRSLLVDAGFEVVAMHDESVEVAPHVRRLVAVARRPEGRT